MEVGEALRPLLFIEKPLTGRLSYQNIPGSSKLPFPKGQKSLIS
jgi:hypothetical protein